MLERIPPNLDQFKLTLRHFGHFRFSRCKSLQPCVFGILLFEENSSVFISCFIVSCFLLVLPEDRFFEWNEQPQTNLRPEDYTHVPMSLKSVFHHPVLIMHGQTKSCF